MPRTSRLLCLILLLAFGAALPAMAQTCDTALTDGATAYDDARAEDALRLLEPCVTRFSTANQSVAYRLIALSHLALGNEAAARMAVRNMLRVNPTYIANPDFDPPAFVTVVEAERVAAQTPVTPPMQTVRSSNMMSNTKGFFGQLGVGYTSIATTVDVGDGDESETESGGGAHLLIGYGITPSLSLFALFDAASLKPEEGDSYTHSEVGLGLRYYFGRATAQLRPYVQVAAAQQTASDDNIDVTGFVGRFGGGVLYFFSPTLALHGELNASVGQYTEVSSGDESVELDDPFSTAGGYLTVGVTFYPFR